MPLLLNSRWTATVLLATALMLAGCRKAAVQPHTPSVQTSTVVGEPAYRMRSPAETDPPWFAEMQVVFDERPADENELQQKVAERKPAVVEAAGKLMSEVQAAVQAQRKASDKWSIVALSIGRGQKSVASVYFIADVGLTKLHARRPVISFNNMPLDLCVNKLSRESALQVSQPRGYNPRVFWSKTDVSAYEALEGVLTQHGFERKFTDTSHRLQLRLQDFPTRAAFVEAVVAGIVDKGKALNSARAAITVFPREAPPAAEKEPEKKAVPAPATQK